MAPKKLPDPNELMIVNDSPGEECRIAILADGHLEELFTERAATATNVGNIYKGKVVNVEAAIQAAFIDYGEGANGFLHISDLHPKYFPGEERTERVGKKIPRRDRPPIQAALRRGDEILVQVLKEGIGTKGPTLTSYLSIPGRLIVMMPDMDRVGVSRKVEDEQKRREMRQILDSLDLPEGFGFILRTAGFDKTKTELKRDAAYLLRLWKVMEKRIKGVGAPCELYTESDLLIRSVRDILRPSIKAIIVDSESAHDRVSMFLRVAAPRSAPKVIRYRRAAPIFHAFDIERQIELIHSREVPLPSGGRLVIDQTEALVAIDVNSGRSRSARDSETNAYETNVEATDEICRQLRLRDLGGLIVNDLIDMRSPKHRRQIEERFETNLKKDRAKATALKISEFGILEMTRQRMRPSIRKAHYMPCPHCNGHGEIRVPEFVAADATRHAGFLLQFERVARVELACSPRVASVLLSAKRRELVRLEDASSKRIDVRVSDAIAMDRVDFYAYDDRNADIDITRLPALAPPSLADLEAEQETPIEIDDADMETPSDERRRRRRRRSGPADSAAIALSGDFADELDALEADEELVESEEMQTASEIAPQDTRPDGDSRGRRRRRRRRRGGVDVNGQREIAAAVSQAPIDEVPAADLDAWPSMHPVPLEAVESASLGASPNGEQPRRKRRRRRGRRGRGGGQGDSTPGQSHASTGELAMGTAEQPVRVHELASELNVSSREVIDQCVAQPGVHDVTSPLSTMSATEANTIREAFAGGVVGGDTETQTAASNATSVDSGSAADSENGRRRRRRRGRRRGKGGPGGSPQDVMARGDETSTEAPGEFVQKTAPVSAPIITTEARTADDFVDAASDSVDTSNDPQPKRVRRRRGRRSGSEHSMSHQSQSMNANTQGSPESHLEAKSPNSTAVPAPTPAGSPAETPIRKPRRALYRAGRGSVSATARDRATQRED